MKITYDPVFEKIYEIIAVQSTGGKVISYKVNESVEYQNVLIRSEKFQKSIKWLNVENSTKEKIQLRTFFLKPAIYLFRYFLFGPEKLEN